LLTATRTENLLSIQSVSLTLGGKKILENVNARIDKLVRPSGEKTGQIVAFLGPSGCGKTTLLRILAGLQQPDTGGVWVGKEHTSIRPGLVGMVSQNAILKHHRTVIGNVELAARMKRSTNPHGVAVDVLRSVDMLDHAEKYPSQLSGGQRQRAAIAQQLACADHFLLMDEPTAGLDPLVKKKVCALISKVANQDDLNTVIVVTHDIRSALAMADTVWLMGRPRDASGKIIGGAFIDSKDIYDTISAGLMWHEDVYDLPEFAKMEREIVARFETL
jgi:ABC-type nitrate/sulfonate/bicarbonate transport system ATPase subunit